MSDNERIDHLDRLFHAEAKENERLKTILNEAQNKCLDDQVKIRKLQAIIIRASARYFKEGPDSETAAAMLEILNGSHRS